MLIYYYFCHSYFYQLPICILFKMNLLFRKSADLRIFIGIFNLVKIIFDYLRLYVDKIKH